MEHCHRRHIAVLVMSLCLQLMLRIIMLRHTASAATPAAPISIGFLHSIRSRSHNHHRKCRLITSHDHFQHPNLLGTKSSLHASSSRSSGSNSSVTSATLKTLTYTWHWWSELLFPNSQVQLWWFRYLICSCYIRDILSDAFSNHAPDTHGSNSSPKSTECNTP